MSCFYGSYSSAPCELKVKGPRGVVFAADKAGGDEEEFTFKLLFRARNFNEFAVLEGNLDGLNFF